MPELIKNSEYNIDAMVDNVWMGLPHDFDSSTLENPLLDAKRGAIYDDNYILDILDVMADPNYFWYTCKYLFNINLAPFQLVLLRELWIRKFPMLIATRGGGKTWILALYAMLRAILTQGCKIVVVGAAFRQSKLIFEYMEGFWRNSPILQHIIGNGRHEGPRRDIDRCNFYLGESEIIAIPLGDGCVSSYTSITCVDGFRFISSVKTPIKVWGNGKFNCSDEHYDNGVKPTKIVTTKKGFSFEGTYNHRMKVLREGMINWVRADDMKVGDRVLIDRSYRWHKGKFSCTDEQAYVLGCMIGDGSLPKTILSASRDMMTACLQGLFDTDGTLQVSTVKGGTAICVSFCNTSEQLVKQIQYILLHYGIISCVSSRQRDNENWNRVWELHITGQNVVSFAKQIGFRLKRKQDILMSAVSNKIRTTEVDNTIPDVKDEMIRIASSNRLKKRGTNCDTGMSVSKIKARKYITFEFANRFLEKYGHINDQFIEKLRELSNTDIFYDEIISIEDSECHTFDIHVPNGHEYCANGFFSHNSKIRGLRANYVLADEFGCLDKNSLVETKTGLVRIGDDNCHDKDIYTGDADCPFERPSNYIITPSIDVYEVKLENGYVIRCSKQHKIMTIDGWKHPIELTNNDFIESNNQYIFPTSQIEDLDEKLAWLMGILISEGSVVNESIISIKTTDEKLADFICTEFAFNKYEREAYIDKRGWNCKRSYDLQKTDKNLRDKLYQFGLDYNYAIDKKVPWSILQSPKNIVLAFLEGAFEGDGSCFIFKDEDCDNRLGVAYYSVSETLCRDIHILLDKLGYDGYINNRSSEISDNLQWFVRLNGNDAYNFASIMNIDRFRCLVQNCYQPSIPTHITYDKVRSKWKVQFKYLNKVIQKRFINKNEAFEYVVELRKLPRFRKVISITILDKQQKLYDYYLPKTNSFYACGSRQHNSIPQEIYEVVIKGFASVSASPAQRSWDTTYIKVLESLGMYDEASCRQDSMGFGNQTVISGTAYYHFNHFYTYWRRYCDIVRSRGEPHVLEEIFHGSVPRGFDWKQYSVARIPYGLLPDGFMDVTQIAQSQAIVHVAIHQMEYEAVFAKDTNGFFKRSLVESCVTRNPIMLPSGPIQFHAILSGSPNSIYVYGIDPASEHDNFSIIILEVWPDHRRIVYCWTVNRRTLRERTKNQGKSNTDSFYVYCCRKIRDLMKVFPTSHIGMDTQGGGISIMEGLHDINSLTTGELPLWPYIRQGDNDQFFWEEKDKPTDREAGLHVLHMVQFANAEFTLQSNHGLRKDFESKVCLFPFFDTVSLGLATEQDKLMNREYDNLEDCTLEIEAMKDELATIQHTQTSGGRDHWDTPETKEPGGKKGRLRKDRYTSLVIANMIARCLQTGPSSFAYNFAGGFVGQAKSDVNGPLYSGPEYLVNQMDPKCYGVAVPRRR